MQQIRIVAFKEGDCWIAQCLEVDVSAQANDLDTLKGRIEVALEGERPLKDLPRAPERFFEMWGQISGFKQSGTTDGLPYEMALRA